MYLYLDLYNKPLRLIVTLQRKVGVQWWGEVSDHTDRTME